MDDGYRVSIIQDTREQKPLCFSRYKYALETKVEGLPFGDYACDLVFPVNRNKELVTVRSKIVYERKSKEDLWGTFGGTRERYDTFKKEYNRAIDAGFQLKVIVECCVTDIMKGSYYFKKGSGLVMAKFSGQAMMKKLETIRNRYNLDFIYCHGRLDMQRYMYERWMAECRECKKKIEEERRKG